MILFLCTGNIYRSASAHFLFENKYPNLKFDSAGIGAKNYDKPMARKMRDLLKEKYKIEVTLNSLRSKHITYDLVEEAKYIICMAPVHVKNLINLYPLSKQKIVKIWEYSNNKINSIKDPAFGGNCEETLRQIEECVDNFLGTIK